jgi:predicted HAD superfamily Cof-like phosphohydrolase
MSLWSDVRDFHKKFDHPHPASPVDYAPPHIIDFRIALIQEECEELCFELRNRNWAGVASESVDLIYVVIGTLVTLGLPLLPFWKAVQSANMSKIKNPTGGKPLKPDGWQAPDARAILYEHKRGWMEDPDGPEMG